jgi:hypothetical protein
MVDTITHSLAQAGQSDRTHTFDPGTKPAVNSPSAITFENNKKTRPRQKMENEFSGVSGGGHDIPTIFSRKAGQNAAKIHNYPSVFILLVRY